VQQTLTTSQLIRQTPAAIYRWLGDRIFFVVVTLLGCTIIALAAMMGWVLWQDAAVPVSEYGLWGFLSGTTWNPVTRIFGIWPFILGTLVTSVAALALSFLPALAVAIYTAEYAPRWLATIIDYTVDLLAAIPSVVVGIWGIFVLVPWLRSNFYLPVYLWSVENAPGLLPILGNPTGYGMLTAVVVLALMIVPYTTALSRDAIKLVPKEQREAAWALGATRWEVMRMAVLPYARGGISAGAVLSFGRAIGETMAVAMLIGNSNNLPFTIFGPAATMPSVIVNEFREAVENLHLLSLMGVGFFLFCISLVVNLVAAYVQRKLVVGSRGL
jgi:phosphate transport system permease protein